MAFSIQVKNNANEFRQGDVVAIRPDNFQYFEGDSMEAWVAAGRSKESWPKTFAILYVTNEEMDGTEPEVQALTDVYSDDPSVIYQRKYYISLPTDINDPRLLAIRETGQSLVTWAEVQALIEEHI